MDKCLLRTIIHINIARFSLFGRDIFQALSIAGIGLRRW